MKTLLVFGRLSSCTGRLSLTVRSLVAGAVAIATLVGGAAVLGQSCGPGWLLNASPTAVSSRVMAVTSWDPDGAGGLPPVIVAGGDFTTTGLSRIATWDGGHWKDLGGGMDDAVLSLITAPNGHLIAGGTFTTAGGGSASRIAEWDGSSWSALGSGITGGSGSFVDLHFGPGVRAMAIDGSGNLIVAGLFTTAGGTSASNIAKWNGSTWSALGSGTDGPIEALAVMGNGDIVAAGTFTTAGGNAAANIARWNGSTWSQLGGGTNAAVFALAVRANGDLLAGGYFTQVNGSSIASAEIAGWDGSSWYALGSGSSDDEVLSITIAPNGDVIAAGDFAVIAGVSAGGIARWDGSAWSAIGAGLSGGEDLTYSTTFAANGDLVVGGALNVAGSATADGIARWDGSTWSALATTTGTDAFNSTVSAFVVTSDGRLIAGGSFSTVNGTTVNGVAQWDGVTWSPLGTSGMNGSVLALERIPVANAPDLIVAGGSFSTADGTAVNNVALWDGSAWQPMNSGSGATLGMNSTVNALAWYPDVPALIAGGSFTHAGTHGTSFIAAWTGPGGSPDWVNPFGLTGMNSTVLALKYHPNTACVIAGGSFTTADGNPCAFVAMLDMANMGQWLTIDGDPTFTSMAGTNGTVESLAVSGNNIFVGGSFSNAVDFSGSPVSNTANIARFDSTGPAWHAMGTGTDWDVTALAMRTASKVVAGGNFTTAGGTTANRIAYWDGSTWSALGSGTDGTVSALAVMPSGEVEVGGSFSTAGGNSVGFYSRWSDDGKPWFAIQPPHGACPVGGDITVSGTVASAYDFDGPLTYQWNNTGTPITDGLYGASALGGTVAGATTDTLTISSFNYHDRGAYTLTVTNSCGSKDSSPTILGMGCQADFNADCALSTQDIFDFLNAWFAADPAADFNHVGGLSTQDIFDFLNAWFAGCS